MSQPNLNKILEAAGKNLDIDTPEFEMVEAAYAELNSLIEEVKALQKAHEATSKALYHLQFVQHEALLNKYCQAKKDLRAVLDNMG
jgi:outer membrane protein TolC